MSEKDLIQLSTMLQDLRKELQISFGKAEKESLRFNLNSIDLELQVVVTKEANASAGTKFWVLDTNAGIKYGDTITHTIKLSMKPVMYDKDGNKLTDIEVSNTGNRT
ncbi:hypothetical protein HY745_14475 [Candidatus Desantisbacteria bacterium]|nr:hypothetical protein [Candidatus Desantisbacteria bacterium]